MADLPIASRMPEPRLGPARSSRGVGDFVRWLRTHHGAVTTAGLLAFAAPITFFTGALSVMRAPMTANWVVLLLWWGLQGVELWALLLVVGYVCLRVVPPAAPAVTQTAWWAGGAIVSAACASLSTIGRAAILEEQGVVQSVQTMTLYSFTLSLTMTLFYFAHLRRSRRHESAVARLAQAQRAQHDARRRIVQAHVVGLQARIDPQLLFGMLEAIRESYQRDPCLPERLLDELIDFLRASLPHLPSSSSSVPREAELARAYARIQSLAGRLACSMTFDLAADVIHARFPPGVLLPLLDDVWRSRAGPCTLTATRTDGTCRVAMSMPARPSDDAIARIRSLLTDLYGRTAWLAIEDGRDSVVATVQVPHELA
jgi:Histidine kinase